jgi:exosortase/archaeosortase family protein
VPTAAARSLHKPALEFVVRGVAWSLALFGLLRFGWFESHAVLPLTHLQARIAQGSFGAPALPINVTLACSGADTLALCVGAILAYPAAWRLRVAGAAIGTTGILTLNTIRIGTLGRVAASPAWFDALHLYVWPGVLMLAVAGYVFGWMQYADQPRVRPHPSAPEEPVHRALPRRTRRFVALTGVLVVLFAVSGSLYLESAVVLAIAAFITRAAAAILTGVGVASTAAGNVLTTTRGAFLVTQECISTPLIPVYVAGALTYPGTWSRRALGLAVTVPLFVALGVLRLLVVALPPALVGSPMFVIHAFYQLLLALVVVCLAAAWRKGVTGAAQRRAVIAVLIGCAIGALSGPAYTRAFASAFPQFSAIADPQGAIAFLPAFQIGLYAALCAAVFEPARWRLVISGLALVALSQPAMFGLLHVLVGHTLLVPHVRDVRAWALAGPIAVVMALVAYDRPHQ